MTTIITLKTVWLSDASDATDFRAFGMMASLQRSASQPARSQRTASGRFRIIRQTGKGYSWAADLPECSTSEIEWLESKLGTTLCARDDSGHKFFATFTDLTVTEHDQDEDADTALSLTEITADEAV